MSQLKSIHRQPAPTETRLPLVLPCTLHLPDRKIEAATFNISYRGLGIKLSSETRDFGTKELQSVTIQDIGTFDVTVHWAKWSKLGIKFCSKNEARPVLNAYFAKTGTYPV